MSHMLTTSNTENIFTVLNRAGVLNPLYSVYYMLLSRLGKNKYWAQAKILVLA